MSDDFRKKRRQKFLTEDLFANEREQLRQSIELWKSELPEGDSLSERQSEGAALVASDSFSLLLLEYTGGTPIPELRAKLPTLIEAYERYQKALAAHEEVPQIAPLSFDELDEYERALQLVSLCYLLHRRDLLPRLRALLDPAYAGEDTVYEDLMAFDVAGRADVDQWYHAEPYTALVNAMYLDQPEANAELKKYCDSWYKCFEYAPWHNSHTRIEGDEGDYFGYWAFEAGAVALLYDLDDSAIDHMVYPRDLVAWARENKALSEEDEKGNVRLRAVAGDVCPREGYWVTPAKTNSRRHFKAGELMPDLGGDYGATIWQWDDRQGS
jgi:Domain of unknown function (DUF1911)/Domain of unknown function (DUF1910)